MTPDITHFFFLFFHIMKKVGRNVCTDPGSDWGHLLMVSLNLAIISCHHYDSGHPYVSDWKTDEIEIAALGHVQRFDKRRHRSAKIFRSPCAATPEYSYDLACMEVLRAI